MVSLWAWGQGVDGQLGLGGGLEEAIVTVPTEVTHRPWVQDVNTNAERYVKSGNDTIVSVSGGDSHTVVVTRAGKVFVCGSNDYAQLGHDKGQKKFELVDSLSAYQIRTVACGQRHNLAVDKWGEVFSWGSDERGQLGHNLGSDRVRKPKMIRGLGTFKVVQVSAGKQHSLVLTDSGRLFAFGDNNYGQLGIGPAAGERVLTPQPVESLLGLPIKHIACGGHHTVIVSMSGAVYVWGRNSHGQLGVGDFKNRQLPTLVGSLREQRVVFVACGDNHTSCLTQDGGIFPFGCGTYGQLGHGTKSNEFYPRKAFELMGSVVSQISCGSNHTLAFVPLQGRLYALGLGGSGQLGINKVGNSETPQGVLERWTHPRGLENANSSETSVFLVSAAGDQSFAAVCQKERLSAHLIDHRHLPVAQQMKTLSHAMLDQISEARVGESLSQEFLESVETVFQSLSSLNGSFLLPTHFGCGSKNPGIDLPSWILAFQKIRRCENETLQDVIYNGLITCVFPKLENVPPDAETLRIYIFLPLYHKFEDVHLLEDLQIPFTSLLLRLNGNPLTIIERWLSMQDRDYFQSLVKKLKAVAEHLLRGKEHALNPHSFHDKLLKILKVLKILHRINEKSSLIEYEDFYIPEMSMLNLADDFYRWRTNRGNFGFCFCDYPFVFDANAKTLLLALDQTAQRYDAVELAHTLAYVSGPFLHGQENQEALTFLTLTINRQRIVADTLDQISQTRSLDLKKPLRVQFVGEEAEDAGGVKKEFFLLLLRDLLDTKYGMFKEYEETGTIWFHDSTFDEDLAMFNLIGVLCGLAIYNFVIINLPFPLALYKKLLGNRVKSVEDLAELSPTTANGLSHLLEYADDDFEDAFGLYFTITKTHYGEVKEIPLLPDGGTRAVTKENRQEFVDLYCDYVLNESVKKAFEAFHLGFHKVCDSQILHLFHARELMALVVGNENYDWQELEETTTYKDGYDKNHPTIVNFWSVFHELSNENKKKFLLFLTGSDRIPFMGMKAVQMTIVKTGDDNHLPVAHTCFNYLDLPEYATREKLKYKLLKAIDYTEGFGLA